MSDTRDIAELLTVQFTGDAVSELRPLMDEGWWLVQLLPQQKGPMIAVLQRKKLLVEVASAATTERILHLAGK